MTKQFTLKKNPLKIHGIGQAGFRFKYAGTVVFIDPYLSNSVQEKESADLTRLKPTPIQPVDVIDADWIIITHEHRDHCDIDTLLPISQASTNCHFMGPPNVVAMLKKAGIDTRRICMAEHEIPVQLDRHWKVYPIPSAHPSIERDTQGKFRWLGYIMKIGFQTFYHAGDTSANCEVINYVNKFGEIDVAFLPVNESNYFLDQRNIIGNMSIREAFQFAKEIGAKSVVPTHWDMFAINGVFKEEIEFLYERLSPKFELLLEPEIRL